MCNQLVQYSRKANGEVLCIYGDLGYQLCPQLQGPFNNQGLTQKQEILINWWTLWENQLNDCLVKTKLFSRPHLYIEFEN